MKTLYVLTLATFIGLAAPIAAADDASAAKPRPAKAQTVADTGAAAPVAKVSQQDKMRLCAKEATGKKGTERKAFMKTCLSKKV
jgi:hypothetical protein